MLKYRAAPRSPLVMTRQYRCADVMSGCAAVLDGRDTAEVMARIMSHFIKDHGIPAPPFELVTKAYAVISDK